MHYQTYHGCFWDTQLRWKLGDELQSDLHFIAAGMRAGPKGSGGHAARVWVMGRMCGANDI